MNKKRKIVIAAASAVALISLLADFLFSKPLHKTLWHAVPGIYILIGAVGAALIIVFAKFVYAPLVQRDENYYGNGDDDDADK